MEVEKAIINQDLFNEVQIMLKDVYPDGNIPPFEINCTTIAILYEILKKLTTKQNINTELALCYDRHAETYSAKAKVLKASLQSVNLSLDDLPQSFQRVTKSLSDATCALQLESPKPVNFTLGLNHLSQMEHDVSNERRKLILQQSKLTKKFNALFAKIDSLEKNISSKKNSEIQSKEIKEKRTKASFLNSKKDEYKVKIRELENKLELSGFDPSIQHSELVKRHKEVLKMEKQLEALNLKLNSYYSLPPNEELAKLKVEEAKQQLLDLEKEIQRRID